MRLSTRAFAMAGAAVSAAVVFGLTLLFVAGPGEASALEPLAGVFFGYSVSVPGAFVGALWAYGYGFLTAGLLAFVYNLALVPPPPPPEDEAGGRERQREAA